MTAFEVFHSMKNKKKGKRGNIAMKLDMSKVYDRVEWDFLEMVMLKLGFCGDWVNLIMRCIRSVSYAVLFNGTPTDSFSPGRGLRQGDPLSPFLFLFCAEAFSALLAQAKSQGRIHGVTVTRNAPPISHLFFADDTILFVRATNDEADEIKGIIRQYEKASGQRINLDKTEITVSSNIPEEKKQELSVRLGVKAVESHSKYLGLPTMVGRKKRQIFAGIVDRVTRKMNDWKERSLSQSDNEVLIKAVIQSIPTYSMNCFLFPIATCQEIERATARFFWGSTVDNKKCHWAAWDILTTAKANGGIGFRELHFFNKAMLAKQLWNILQHPESITFKILKAKYFPRVDLMSADVGYKPSFLWRSLLSVKELIQEGIAWRVGNGKQINTYTDRWIGVDKPKVPTNIADGITQVEKVESFIDIQRGRWRRDLIEDCFTANDAQQILSIPLSNTLPNDRMIWRFTKMWIFTVKSAYHVAVQKFSRIHDDRSSASEVPKEWKKIWELKVIPRVKMFIWRACMNALPTKDNLCRRGCDIDPICQLCGDEIETLDHVLLHCRIIRPIWYMSVLRVDGGNIERAAFKEFFWKYFQHQDGEAVSLVATMAHGIWKERNSSYFEKKQFSSHEVMTVSHTRWVEFLERDVCRRGIREKKPASKWQLPCHGKYKLNCDVAVRMEGRVGYGFVLRDEFGNVKLAGKEEDLAMGSSTLVEGRAMRFALQVVKQYGMTATIIESDSKLLIDSINGRAIPEVYLDILICDIRQLAIAIHCEIFSYIPRQANQTAHNAARGHDFIAINHSPTHLNKFLTSDVRD